MCTLLVRGGAKSAASIAVFSLYIMKQRVVQRWQRVSGDILLETTVVIYTVIDL